VAAIIKVLAVMGERLGIFVLAAGVIGAMLKFSDSVAAIGDKLVCVAIIVAGLILVAGCNFVKHRC